MLAFYEAARTGRPLVLRPVPQYREYIGWLRQRDRSRDREYWTGVLGDLDTTGSLPSLRSTPAIDGMADYAMTRFTLPQALSGAIQQFARAHQLTLTTVILGCYGVLLAKYTGEQDVVVGLTVSGRPPDLPGADSIVGLFINTLPVRLLLKREARVTDWHGRLQETLSEKRELELTRIEDAEIVRTAYRLLHREGLFLGGTSGTNVAAAVRVARELGPGNTVVTILCDGGHKYLSRFYSREYLEQRGLAEHAEAGARRP